MNQPLLFKVTDKDGFACNHSATSFQYDLPTAEGPGKWTKPIKDLVLCTRGYHLTAEPGRWWNHQSDRRLFVAEFKGEVVIQPGDKICAESVRLVEEITPEWKWLPMFPHVRALLISQWRRANPGADELPDWAVLRGADLRGTDLSGTDLRGADLSGTDLRGADLRDAYLRGADLRGTYLRGADLSGADLRDAYLRGADLRGTYLRGTDLRGAVLRGAVLRGAVLRGAVLRGADLRGTDLSGTDLRGARFFAWERPLLPEQYELDSDGVVRFKEQRT